MTIVSRLQNSNYGTYQTEEKKKTKNVKKNT